MTIQATEESGSPAPREEDRTRLRRLRDSIDASLDPLVAAGTRCALVDFPNSGNVGDAAIWAGEKAWLRRAGVDVVYSCDRYTYSRTRLRKELKDGTILWHGGGNLGDLWPGFQAFRETVVATFPDNPIVQFPQSVWFVDANNAARAAAVFNKHENLHLLLRDTPSLSRARELFEAPASLSPDMAFALDPPARDTLPLRDVVWLSRTDVEASDRQGEPAPEALVLDWLSDTAPHLRKPLATYTGYALNRVFSAGIRRWPPRFPSMHRVTQATYDRRAHQRLERGFRILTMGSVVVTDRLHGHILCCLLGKPHVILGDKFGKLRSFYETWTSDFSTAVFAGSAAEAWTKARQLLTASPTN